MLAFDRANTLTFAGVISGGGAAVADRLGTTILTADSPYTGGTTVSRGASRGRRFRPSVCRPVGRRTIAVGVRRRARRLRQRHWTYGQQRRHRRRKRHAGFHRLADRHFHHQWRLAQSRADPARFRREHRQCARGSRRLCRRRRQDGHQHISSEATARRPTGWSSTATPPRPATHRCTSPTLAEQGP